MTVEVGGPAGCLHEDFNGDLTNASGQAPHSLEQWGHAGTVTNCLRVTRCIRSLGWPLIFTSIFIVLFLPLTANCQIATDAECCLPELR